MHLQVLVLLIVLLEAFRQQEYLVHLAFDERVFDVHPEPMRDGCHHDDYHAHDDNDDGEPLHALLGGALLLCLPVVIVPLHGDHRLAEVLVGGFGLVCQQGVGIDDSVVVSAFGLAHLIYRTGDIHLVHGIPHLCPCAAHFLCGTLYVTLRVLDDGEPGVFHGSWLVVVTAGHELLHALLGLLVVALVDEDVHALCHAVGDDARIGGHFIYAVDQSQCLVVGGGVHRIGIHHIGEAEPVVHFSARLLVVLCGIAAV